MGLGIAAIALLHASKDPSRCKLKMAIRWSQSGPVKCPCPRNIRNLHDIGWHLGSFRPPNWQQKLHIDCESCEYTSNMAGRREQKILEVVG